MELQLLQWAEALRNPDVATRRQAAEQLAQRGEQLSPVALRLVAATADADETVREWSVAALEHCGAPPAEDIAQLTGLLATTEELPAYWSATLLGRLEGRAASAVEPLMQTVQQHLSAAVRERAVWALGMLGRAALPAVPLLERVAEEGGRPARLAQHALTQIRR